MNRLRLSKTGLCILITAILGAAALLLILAINRPRSRQIAHIYQDGVLLKTIDLSTVDDPVEWTVAAANGGFNTIRAEHGSICVIEASCPDHVCIHTGKISGPLLPIACLPNGLLIRIENDVLPGLTDNAGTQVDDIAR